MSIFLFSQTKKKDFLLEIIAVVKTKTNNGGRGFDAFFEWEVKLNTFTTKIGLQKKWRDKSFKIGLFYFE